VNNGRVSNYQVNHDSRFKPRLLLLRSNGLRKFLNRSSLTLARLVLQDLFWKDHGRKKGLNDCARERMCFNGCEQNYEQGCWRIYKI
jgi:hypothetical protein